MEEVIALKTIKFFAVVLMALALVPAGAHFFELFNKIGLDRESYFTVQDIYRGWNLFAIVDFGALFVTLLLTIALRRQRGPRLLAFLGFLSIVASLAVFFTWTFPANQATVNWTEVPENWAALRTQWECSHAANALILFLGFCATTLAAITARHD